MTRRKNLFLEESVLDDLSQEFDYLELPLSVRAFRLIIIVAAFLALVVISRIAYLGWANKDFYTERALANASHITTTRAERGIILDREGQPLLTNLPAFRISINLAELLKNKDNEEQLSPKLESILGLPSGYIADLVSNVNLEKQSSLTVSRQASVDQVIKLKNLNSPAILIESDFKRQYTDGYVFSQIIGYTGAVDKNDLNSDPSLALNDTIGKTGLEAYYEDQLKGQDGETINYRDVGGKVIGDKTMKAAVPGDELYLTIDSDLQKYFYNRLVQGVTAVGSKSGVGIALNPQTGEVLALVDVPSFDNNQIQAKDLTSPTKPMFNRAISGGYSPGSTIKPLVAYAALKENIISPDKQIYSPGYLDVPNPYNPDEPTRFLDWRPQGWVDIYSALAKSSDVYFYEVGGGFGDQLGLGISRLKEYWQKFGLGSPTGIDLPGEASGFLPDPQTKEKSAKDIWRIGDTYNVSIGQGDLLVTPIELINYLAAVANGGKIYRPFLVEKIADSNGKVLSETTSQALADYSADTNIWKIIQKGMVDGVVQPYGTSHLLADLPIEVAAKTGTAQIQLNTKTNAFFVGYAPRVNAQIAVLVLIENAREGSLNAVPVAKDVFRWYYENKIAKNNLTSK